MIDLKTGLTCKSCGSSGTGNYCSVCGQPFKTKRITLSTLVHDIFHFFTHLDKGFGYTLKMLILAPGYMQRSYLEGDRVRYQKPFSMFFICATVTAISRYWIFLAIMKYYHAGSVYEANFFHEYMVMLHLVLMPVYVLITYLLFYKSGYNYAETGVLLLYTTSIFLLISILISLLRFFWHELDTAYIELPIFAMYNLVTFINFFHRLPRWQVVIKSLIGVVIIFLIIQKVEDWIIPLISN